MVLEIKKSWKCTDVVTFYRYEIRPGSWELSKMIVQSFNCLNDSAKFLISCGFFPGNKFFGEAKRQNGMHANLVTAMKGQSDGMIFFPHLSD